MTDNRNQPNVRFAIRMIDFFVILECRHLRACLAQSLAGPYKKGGERIRVQASLEPDGEVV